MENPQQIRRHKRPLFCGGRQSKPDEPANKWFPGFVALSKIAGRRKISPACNQPAAWGA